MKVLFINTVYGKGSTGRIIKEIGKELVQNGHDYVAAYGRGPDAEDGHGYRVGGKWSVYTHALLSRLTDRAGFYSKKATKELVKFITEYKPDVIHLHNLHGYYVNLETLFNYLKNDYKGKVVWTLHDCWAFTGHCVHYTYAKCDKWKTGCHHCPEKKSYPASLWRDNSKESYEKKRTLFTGVPNMRIATVSQWLKEQAEDSFLGCYPVDRVYNGIDYNLFRPLPSNIRETLGIGNRKMVLSVSDGWNERKGFNRLMALAKEAPADWCFVIVGLEKKQIPLLPKNCIGMERTWTQEDLVKLYTAADVFYNPSVEETFGLVTAEALACGTPAVVMDSTASPELVWDKTYGQVLPVTATCKENQEAILLAMKEKTRKGKKTFSLEENLAQNLSLYS